MINITIHNNYFCNFILVAYADKTLIKNTLKI